MRLPRVPLPKSVLLFIAGALFGSFISLKFSSHILQNPPPLSPELQDEVQGESVVEEGDQKTPETSPDSENAVLFGVSVREEKEKVARVIDGDTIELANGVRVRYIGIDASEMSAKGRDRCLAEAAKAANKSLVEGKEVELTTDITDKDHFGRSLRYVWADSVWVNEALVEQGLAHAVAYFPDTKYQTDFEKAEEKAKTAKQGMWGSVCASVSGTLNEKSSVQPDSDLLPSTCEIKGNISAAGENIYHFPNCRSYGKTVINVSDGERWFCTEKDALDAGWRKALDCP